MNHDALAHLVMERCDILGAISEEEERLTRPFASQAMRRVNETVETWMQAAGMHVERDAIGNIIGRYEASGAGAKTLLLGSHLDSVRDAGKYDGPLGVMVALACVQQFHEQGKHLPFAIEVLGFADEEGMRYLPYLGSKASTGTFDPSWLDIPDAEEITLAQAIRAFGGNPDPRALQTARWRREDVLAYAEVHIEQGPVLEQLGLPVGIVTSIVGQSRMRVSFTGMAGHAGTVPMPMRRDALSAAAEFVLTVERLASIVPGLVATIGQLSVQPGVSNVIPGKATLSLDVRHQDDRTREQAFRDMEQAAEIIGERRGIAFERETLEEQAAVPCSPRLMDLFTQSIEQGGMTAYRLPSGAGHDAAVMAQLADIAMLFVRCKGGISHNPAESVTTEDVGAALSVLERFVMRLAEDGNA